MDNETFKQTAIRASILVLIGVIALIILDITTDIFKTPKEVIVEKPTTQESQIKPSEFPDFSYFEDLKNKNKVLTLVSDGKSWVEENLNNKEKEVKGRVYKKFIKADGDIINGYLFINVSVNSGKPLTKWDSIYISLRKIVNNYLYEPQKGHLLRSQSLAVPPSDITRLLYDLKEIPLTTIPYSNNNKFWTSNWLTLLQQAEKFELETFLSTFSKEGKINEISIGYECAEKTPDCKLSIVE